MKILTITKLLQARASFQMHFVFTIQSAAWCLNSHLLVLRLVTS